jgi:UDP-glucose 6-dehydrogenase
MENCFLATKVAFVNQFYDIAAKLGVDFAELRQLWLADPRIGPSHSSVTEERGFRGRCLPKDVSALVAEMKELGGAPLLEAVLEYNRRVCRASDKRRLASARAIHPLRVARCLSRVERIADQNIGYTKSLSL